MHAAAASTDGAEVDAAADAEPAPDAAGAESDAEPVAAPVDQTASMGANGLAFDAAGMIWLADLFGNQLLRLDPSNGEILARLTQNVSGPDDVAIDTRGRVFWTNWTSGEIARLDPSTNESEIIATLPSGANSIAFTTDGRLFIGLVLLHQGLYEVDPEGVREARLVTDTISDLNAFDIGPDGLLWGPMGRAIVKLDLESGELVETIAEGGYASVRYSERDHALFAITNGADGASPGLDQIDLDDHHVTRLSDPMLAGVDNFAIGPEGEFFVTGYDKPLFVVINPDGLPRALVQVGAAAER